MTIIKYILSFLLFLLPITSSGQHTDILPNLSQAFEHGKESIEHTIKAIENMAEAYKNMSSNNGKRFIVSIKTHLSDGLVHIKAAQESTSKAEVAAQNIEWNSVKQSTSKAKQLFNESETSLLDALNYATKAYDETNATEIDLLLKQAVSPIENAVKKGNEALDLLNEAAHELNNKEAIDS